MKNINQEYLKIGGILLGLFAAMWIFRSFFNALFGLMNIAMLVLICYFVYTQFIKKR